ncbi:MAG: hypothetical protein KDA99_23230, partial [Planctomycetales bacterium]|nr:hypothetical protein [Planctomycetales bacterium]
STQDHPAPHHPAIPRQPPIILPLINLPFPDSLPSSCPSSSCLPPTVAFRRDSLHDSANQAICDIYMSVDKLNAKFLPSQQR